MQLLHLFRKNMAYVIIRLNEMKKIRGGKKSSHDLPDDVGGANGQASIVEKFCDVYEELNNSSGSEEALEEIKSK